MKGGGQFIQIPGLIRCIMNGSTQFIEGEKIFFIFSCGSMVKLRIQTVQKPPHQKIQRLLAVWRRKAVFLYHEPDIRCQKTDVWKIEGGIKGNGELVEKRIFLGEIKMHPVVIIRGMITSVADLTVAVK